MAQRHPHQSIIQERRPGPGGQAQEVKGSQRALSHPFSDRSGARTQDLMHANPVLSHLAALPVPFDFHLEAGFPNIPLKGRFVQSTFEPVKHLPHGRWDYRHESPGRVKHRYAPACPSQNCSSWVVAILEHSLRVPLSYLYIR